MRTTLIALGLVVFIAVAAVAAVLLVPLDMFRVPLERAASNAVGREVHIQGALHGAIYPEIGISAADVTIANVERGQAPEFAHVGTLIVGAKLWPLFQHRVEVTKLILQNPVIHLEVEADGHANWNLHPVKGVSLNKPKVPKNKNTDPQAKTEIDIPTITIANGAVGYVDVRSGKTRDLSKANVTLTLAALDQPAVLDVNAVYNNETIALNIRADSPESYTHEMPTMVGIALKSRLVNLDFQGSVTGATDNSGTVNISGPSLRDLLVWTGRNAPKGEGYGAFSLAGDVATMDRMYALKNAKLTLDGMNGSADVSVDNTNKTPIITGALSVDRLDLGAYLSGKEPKTSKKAKGEKEAKTKDWSAEPLKLAGLKNQDGDVTVNVGELTLGSFALSKARMNVALHGGRLVADITQAGMFGGSGTGHAVVDTANAVPAFAAKLDVRAAQIEPLLDSTLKTDRIEGTGAVNIDVTGHGDSQKAIMASLNGNAGILVHDGALHGVDLPGMAQALKKMSLNLKGLTGDQARTDFSELGASFAVQNGVMHNSDLHMINPTVRIAGSGDIDVGRRAIDFHIEPHIVSKAELQGDPNAKGLGVPFHVSGSWDKVKYQPDVKALVNEVVQDLRTGKNKLGDLLGNLLGGKKKNKKPRYDDGGDPSQDSQSQYPQ